MVGARLLSRWTVSLATSDQQARARVLRRTAEAARELSPRKRHTRQTAQMRQARGVPTRRAREVSP